jgi:DNA-binding beta-propeller fold protein YncE
MYPSSSRLLRTLSCLALTATSALTLASAASAAGLLLVANKGSQSVSLVDPKTDKEIATIAEDGVTGHELIASPDGKRAYVPIYGDSGVGRPGTDGQLIRVLDLQSKKIVGTIDFGKGIRPHCPLIHPKTGQLYVTTELDQTISIIDPETLKIVGSIPTGQPQSHMLILSHDGRRGYTANVGPGTVSVLDLENRKLIKTIAVAPNVQRIAISPDDRWVVTADQTALRLVVIDTQTNEVSFSIPVPGLAYGTAFTNDGKSLLVALPAINQIGVIDFNARKLVRTLDVAKSPQAVLIRPDQAVAYTSCIASKQIAAIDLKTWKVTLIDVGPGADGLAWAGTR